MVRDLLFEVSNGRIYRYKFNTNSVVALRGDMISVDSLLSIIEREQAFDHSEYYDSFDKRNGVVYKDGTSKVVVKKGLDLQDCRCIRYAGGEAVRSFVCTSYSQGDNLKQESIAFSSYTTYSRFISDALWLRFITIVNSIFEKDAVVSLHGLGSNECYLEFNLSRLPEGVSEQCFMVLYLVLSEVYFSNEKSIVLISKLELDNKDVLDRLLTFLEVHTKVELALISLPENMELNMSNSRLEELRL